MIYPPDFIEKIRSSLSISQIIRTQVVLKAHGHEYLGLCPFHKEKTPSFTVNDQKGFYHCFGCGAHGDAFDFVMNTQNLNFSETVERLAEHLGFSLPMQVQISPEQSQKRQSLLDLIEDATLWYFQMLHSKSGKLAFKYITNRVSNKEIDLFKLGFSPKTPYGQNSDLANYLLKKGYSKDQLLESGLLKLSKDNVHFYDRLEDRLIFPIQNHRSKYIAFGGRVLDDSKPKYLNTSETNLFQKRETLYNYAAAKDICRQEKKQCLVVEGYMDVIALHQAGIQNAVAPLGTSLTEEHLTALWKISSRPLLCFDGDTAGYNAALRVINKALPLLTAKTLLGFVLMPAGQDPDSYVNQHGLTVFQKECDKALSVNEMMWIVSQWNKDLKNPEDRSRIEFELFDQIKVMQDASLKKNYQQFFKQKIYEASRFSKFNPRDSKNSYARSTETISESYFQQKYEAALLASLLNHAYLITDYIEELAQIHFSSKIFDKIREEIIALSVEELDKIKIKDHLTSLGHEKILENIFAADIMLFAQYAKESTSKEMVEAGIKLCLDFLKHQNVRYDMDSAEDNLAKFMTNDIFNQLKELKKNSPYADVLKRVIKK